jgi:hypothetical protein
MELLVRMVLKLNYVLASVARDTVDRIVNLKTAPFQAVIWSVRLGNASWELKITIPLSILNSGPPMKATCTVLVRMDFLDFNAKLLETNVAPITASMELHAWKL